MKAFALAAGRRAAAGVAAAGVTAAQPNANARAPAAVQAPERPQVAPSKHVDDEWLVTEMENGDTVLFQPFKPEEIDGALAEVAAMVKTSIPRPAVVIEELDAGVPVTGLGALLTGTSSSAGAPARTHGQQQGSTTPLSEDSTLSSEGAQADYVIEQATLLNTSSMGKAGAAQQPAAGYLQQQQQLDDLLRITSRMLRRPGLQQEVVKAMLEDEEVQQLVLRQSRNIDAYLAAVGISTPGLLPPPAAAALSSHPTRVEEGDEEEGNPVLSAIMDAVSVCLDKAGNALAGLGSWLRDRFLDLGDLLAFKLAGPEEGEEEAETQAEGQQEQGGRRRRGKRSGADVVLGSVMVVAVAVLCVLITRRPMVLRRA